jgi:MipA family protein
MRGMRRSENRWQRPPPMRHNRAMSRFLHAFIPRSCDADKPGIVRPTTKILYLTQRLAMGLAGLLILPVTAHAEQLPLWEIGAGLAALSLPDYRGSDVTQTFVLPVPYIRYRGEYLRADRDGFRGILFDSERLEFNISLNGSLPADSDDNPAREGMADLEPTLEIGPSVDFQLWRSTEKRMKLALRVPLRAAITLESSPQHIGWQLWPNLKLDVNDTLGHSGWDFDIQAGPNFSDQSFNAYFYSVGPADVTPVRPAYEASAGYCRCAGLDVPDQAIPALLGRRLPALRKHLGRGVRGQSAGKAGKRPFRRPCTKLGVRRILEAGRSRGMKHAARVCFLITINGKGRTGVRLLPDRRNRTWKYS